MDPNVHPKRRTRSVPHYASELGVAQKKVTGWIKSGQLRAINLAQELDDRPRYAIDVVDIEAFERSREIVPSAGPTTRKLRKSAGAAKDFF